MAEYVTQLEAWHLPTDKLPALNVGSGFVAAGHEGRCQALIHQCQ